MNEAVRSPLEALADELGAVAGRIEREVSLRVSAAVSDLERRDAERELRVVNLERQFQARLAELKDGQSGPQGEPGRDGAPGEVGPRGDTGQPGTSGPQGEPGPPGADGRDADPEAVATLVREAVQQAVGGLELPPGEKGDAGERGADGLPGKDGEAGRNGADGKDGAAGRDGVDGAPGKDGEPGERGPEGPSGKLPPVAEWRDGVHYEGAVVSHGGSAYQALRDTGREPPHEDWRCIARAGRDGADGRSIEIRSTWSADETYRALNIVALNGASFIARKDDPGPCPGPGWQLMAGQGKAGKPGERGAQGPRGERGDPGFPIVAATVDDEGLLTLTNGDGSTVTCDLYPLLTRIAR